MAVAGNTKKKKLEAARMRRIFRGAKKMGNPLPGHGKNTPTADVERLQSQGDAIAAYWGTSK